MTLTPGGSRLLATASQIVVRGAEAHAAVRAAQGAPEQLRVVASPTFAEFVASPLTEAFRRRFAGPLEVSSGVAVTQEMGVLVGNRLADVAIGPKVPDDPDLPVVSEPIFRYRLVLVTAGWSAARHTPAVAVAGGPSGAIRTATPGSCWRRAGSVRTDRGVPQPDRRVGAAPTARGRVGGGASGQPATAPGELSLVDVPGAPVNGCWHVTLLERQHRSTVASALRRFLTTPEAMQLMRAPTAGVPPSRFRPPVYVTIWS
jgi:DNA-binding transcriptional LysR family regulator